MSSSKLYKFIKEEKELFTGAHAIYTPEPLVDEILSKVTIKGKILILFNIEFPISLVYNYNIEPKNLTFYSDHENKTKIANRLGIKVIERLDIDMKFDVIIGNPPYNDIMGDNRSQSKNTNNSNLYFDFIQKSIEMNPKFISLIVPAGWMQNQQIKETVLEAGLKKVKEIDPAYFPGVGIRSGISMLHIESNYRGKIEIESLTSSFNIDRDAVLSFDNPKKFKIIEKLKQNKMFDSLLSYGPYKVPKGTKGSIDRLISLDSNYSETQNNEFNTKVMIYAGGSLANPRYLYHTTNFTEQKWGVAVPSASDKYIIGAVRLIEPGTGVSDKLKVAYFNTEDEAKNAKEFLESKLISFVIRTTKHNDTVNTNKNSFGNIPIINFSKPFNENNLLKEFKITQDELNVIN